MVWMVLIIVNTLIVKPKSRRDWFYDGPYQNQRFFLTKVSRPLRHEKEWYENVFFMYFLVCKITINTSNIER